MPKRKPIPKPRTRRSPDDRCLEHSENRLEHALAEQLMHATALAQLEAEIPRLRAIIAALKPETVQTARVVNSQELQRIKSIIPVPDHLKRFIQPVQEVVEDEDLLRAAKLPGDEGSELLP